MDNLTKYRSLVKKGLGEFILGKQKKDHTPTDWLADFYDRLEDFSDSGKLLRGCLVCYSYNICSGLKPNEKVIETAVAMELVHSGLLIQDDVMDQDELRRGLPAIHLQYAHQGEKYSLSEPYNFGVNMAICAGDIAVFLAYEALSQSISNPDADREIQKLFSLTLADVCGGQMQDLFQQESTEAPDKDMIIELMRAKTASYSLALPLSLGAVLAGSTKQTRDNLYKMGIHAGIIFQIRDDELGIFGDTQKLGKPVGADIIKCKKTLLYYYLHKACHEDERIKLNFIFGNEAADLSDIKYVQDVMIRHKIPALIKKDIDTLKKSALSSIGSLDSSKKVKTELEKLVEYCAARQY